jgi:hypothetical protein
MRKCDFCGQSVVSRVSPDKPYKMYCRKCWWSDKWDATDFGRDYDFSKTFFAQYRNLLNSTPHVSIFNANVLNSEWVNQETDDKNCYLNVGGHYNEDSAYDTYSVYGKDCFDSFWILHSELCYENLNCERCYKTAFSRECFNCHDTYFSSDCRGCSNIFGCAGLRNKQYYIFNQPYTKEAYFEFLKNNPISSFKNVQQLKEKAKKIWSSIPHKFAIIVKSVNSTGHFINESKKVKNCWNFEKGEDSKHSYIGGWMRDSYDTTSHGSAELTYEGASGGGVYNSKFLTYCMSANPLAGFHSKNIEFCFACVSCSNCFGCANLRNKEYYIFNKQYAPESYKETVEKIKKHMNDMPYIDKKGRVYKYGEFFPIELSPFGYNETAAQDYYPLTKEQAIENGYPWSDYVSDTKYEISDYGIPDNIKDVKDDVLEKILKCEITGKAYKIIKMELEFYRKMELPIPRRCPLQRHKDRISQLLPRRLYSRKCMCRGLTSQPTTNNLQQPAYCYKNTAKHHHHGDNPCPNEFETTYSPDRPEIVYCEKCYNAEVA